MDVAKEKEEIKKGPNFIHQIIEEDLKNGRFKKIITRFPPEPNGYLHIGHAKAICLSFGTALKYNGLCNLRFDDTNPVKEDVEYVDAIKEDIKWLGFKWDNEYYASDYFENLYNFALDLIKKGLAYVDDQTPEQIASQKGSPTEPGQESPFRKRIVEENFQLFEKMRNGEFQEGACVLRAKIDMTSSNMHLRDPILYRILHKEHHRTGNKWMIYPMYDFTHGQCDFFEGITHSLCSLEFEVHRPLYEWFIELIRTSDYKPRQIEFARLNLSYTVMSKRRLLELVEKKVIDGWDDPRLPTISGLRRRGYTAESVRNFTEMIGIAKRNCVTDISILEYCLREDLNKKALRVMGVLNPIKVIITNYIEESYELLDAINNPEDELAGTRQISFSKELYIEREDFMEDAPKGYFRLTIGQEVRLRYAYFIKCNEVVKDKKGNIVELHCTYDPASKGGKSPDGRKVKGTIHWVDAKNNLKAEVKLYDRLFSDEAPDQHDNDFKNYINPHSLNILTNCILEKSLEYAKVEDRYQFERLGYFCLDKKATPENPIFNRTVSLKDSWSKEKEK